MKAIIDRGNLLGPGLEQIRRQFNVPEQFPVDVLAAAASAASRVPSDHVDRTDWAFVTLDPASSTDLDQAFTIERSGADLLLHYAIADVNWFVRPGDPLDVEAWQRGTTRYLPDGKAPLYPPALSEAAASLLPGDARPAVVFHVRVDPTGGVRLDGATRSLIRSRSKLAYDTVRADDLPPDFAELAKRMEAAERARGAARVEAPEQEVSATAGGFTLVFRPRLASEAHNAAMSLATNMAVADALYAAGTGLFRVMDEPDERAIRRLRHTATAFGLEWADAVDLAAFERDLDPGDPRHAAMMMAVRRAGGGASYQPFRPGQRPWHAAMAATYAHATAPLRRLADRYVVQAAWCVANGRAVPDWVSAAFDELPNVMARADGVSAQVDRAVIDLAEVAMLSHRIGATFPAVITDEDERGARIQLCDLPIVARVRANGVDPGDEVRVKLVSVDPGQRTLTFERVA